MTESAIDSLPRPLPGTDIRALDLHVHSGLERVPPLDDLVHWLIQDGRRYLGLLDHAFLFDYEPDRLAAWQQEKGLPANYPAGRAGLHAFYTDVTRLKSRPPGAEVVVLQGLEVYEGHAPPGGLAALPPDVLAPLDFVGYEFKLDGLGSSEDEIGQHLSRAAEAVRRLYEDRGIPGYLCHPFRATLEPLVRGGRAEAPVLHGRGAFPRRAVDRWLAALDPRCVLVEINYRELAGLMRRSTTLQEMVRHTVQQLKAGGAQFSFGSDLHPAYGFRLPDGPDPTYRPDSLLEVLGLTVADFAVFQPRRVGLPAVRRRRTGGRAAAHR